MFCTNVMAHGRIPLVERQCESNAKGRVRLGVRDQFLIYARGKMALEIDLIDEALTLGVQRDIAEK